MVIYRKKGSPPPFHPFGSYVERESLEHVRTCDATGERGGGEPFLRYIITHPLSLLLYIYIHKVVNPKNETKTPSPTRPPTHLQPMISLKINKIKPLAGGNFDLPLFFFDDEFGVTRAHIARRSFVAAFCRRRTADVSSAIYALRYDTPIFDPSLFICVGGRVPTYKRWTFFFPSAL